MRSTLIPPGRRSHFLRLPAEIKIEIAQQADIQGLSRLARCSKEMLSLLIPTLYERNALEQNSSAILFALLSNYPRILANAKRPGMNTLDLAVKYKGNVNALHLHGEKSYVTALHVAAARGNVPAVKILLQRGAFVNSSSRHLLKIEALDIDEAFFEERLSHYQMAAVSRHVGWLPLFVPYVLGFSKVVEILLFAGAPAKLAIGLPERNIPAPAITILHVLAADNQLSQAYDHGKNAIAQFQNEIDTRLPGYGNTALMIAASKPNAYMVDALLSNNADVHMVTGRGCAIAHAINACYRTKCKEQRKAYPLVINSLIQSGARVDQNPAHPNLDSPLVMALLAVPQDNYKGFAREMKAIISLLLDNGADLNQRSVRGVNLIQYLYVELAKNFNETLFNLLTSLVDQGADLNLPFASGATMLGNAIRNLDHTSPRLVRLLMSSGARIAPHEASNAFTVWFMSPKLQAYCYNMDYDILAYKAHIPQEIVNSAYLTTFSRDKKSKLFQTICENFPTTTVAECLMLMVLGCNGRKLCPDSLILPFKPDWVDLAHGRSFLHTIVFQLGENELYRESMAIHDAEFFIERGTSVCLKDKRGKTAIQNLRALDKPYKELRLLLLEARDRQTGEY